MPFCVFYLECYVPTSCVMNSWWNAGFYFFCRTPYRNPSWEQMTKLWKKKHVKSSNISLSSVCVQQAHLARHTHKHTYTPSWAPLQYSIYLACLAYWFGYDIYYSRHGRERYKSGSCLMVTRCNSGNLYLLKTCYIHTSTCNYITLSIITCNSQPRFPTNVLGSGRQMFDTIQLHSNCISCKNIALLTFPVSQNIKNKKNRSWLRFRS